MVPLLWKCQKWRLTRFAIKLFMYSYAITYTHACTDMHDRKCANWKLAHIKVYVFNADIYTFSKFLRDNDNAAWNIEIVKCM